MTYPRVGPGPSSPGSHPRCLTVLRHSSSTKVGPEFAFQCFHSSPPTEQLAQWVLESL